MRPDVHEVFRAQQQRELAEVIFGLRPVTAGRVMLDGQNVAGKSPCDLNRLGMSYIPEERMRDGMIKEFTVAENTILREFDQPPFARAGFMNRGAIRQNSEKLVKAFSVKTAIDAWRSGGAPAGKLVVGIDAAVLDDECHILAAAGQPQLLLLVVAHDK